MIKPCPICYQPGQTSSLECSCPAPPTDNAGASVRELALAFVKERIPSSFRDDDEMLRMTANGKSSTFDAFISGYEARDAAFDKLKREKNAAELLLSSVAKERDHLKASLDECRRLKIECPNDCDNARLLRAEVERWKRMREQAVDFMDAAYRERDELRAEVSEMSELAQRHANGNMILIEKLTSTREELERWKRMREQAVDFMDTAYRERDAEKARSAKLREALEFYATPETYFAIGLFPDKPCGEFMDDISDCEGEEMGQTRKPGKRAREALAAYDTKNGKLV